MGVLPQALEIIFEVQRKRSNENITRKIKAFQVTKRAFFSFLWTSPTFKAFNFLISGSFKMI
jgi:phage-related protein